MKHVTTLKIVLAISVCTGGIAAARAQTIQTGIQSITTSTAANTIVPGSVGTAYITATFGTTDYIQDSTGAVEAFKQAGTGQALAGLTTGTQVTNLAASGTGTAGFELFSTYNQFEFTTPTGTTSTTSGNTPGTPGSIPLSFYTSLTPAQANLTSNQGGLQSGAISQGIQNQLAIFNNVTIETSAGVQATGNFVSATTYMLVDTSGTTTGSVPLYINTASGLGGTAIPQGDIEVAGIDSEFNKAPEILPRGAYDFYAANATVPEPTTYLAGALTIAAGAFGVRRRCQR